ncbi:putative multidrug export ATP-binding/permease protein [compost metagenome]
MRAYATHGAAEGMPAGMPSQCREDPHVRKETWQWLLEFVVPQWRQLSIVLLLSLVAAGAGLVQPLLTKHLIDDGILPGRFDLVLQCVSLIVGLAMTSALLGGSTRYLYANASARILHAMREALFRHLMTLSPSFYARTRQGDIHVRLDGDIGEIQRFAVDSLLTAVNSVVVLVGSVLILGLMSWELTALMFLVLVFNSLFLKLIRPYIESTTRRVRERGSDIAAFFVEVLGCAKCVQIFNGQQRENARLLTLHQNLRRETLNLQMLGYVAGTVPSLVLSLATAAVFLFGSHQIMSEGTMTLGVLIAFVTYMQRASGPVQTLLGLYVGYQRAKVSLVRVQELARQSPDIIAPRAQDRVVVVGRGNIELKDVGFSYPGTDKPVFQSLTVVVPAGSRVALRGPSGIGKSTLVDLLQRHFDPTVGCISLDGVDLRAIDLECLRRTVCVVSQEVHLFSGSILENIRYGRPDASDDEVLAIARMAGVNEFADSLPDGLLTQVGQRGGSLSGGQKQRIALARAILVEPKVLILDESTSGIDLAQESLIHREIDRLFAGRTRIIISHRPLPGAHFDLTIDLGEYTVETQP